VKQLDLGQLLRRRPQQPQLRFLRGMRLFAFFADPPHQPLRHDGPDGRGHQEGLDADVDQARHRTGRVVRMQGTEHQMARQRGIHRDLRGLVVADFTDHDDVGRLAQDRPQRRGECHPDVGTHLHLVDAAHLVFHRIFHRDDFAVRLVDGVQAGIQRRRLARPGRARHQQDAVRQADQPLEHLLVVGEEAQLGQAQCNAGFVQDTHDDAFAVVRRDGRHAQVQVAAHHVDLDAAVLGHALLRDAHVRHDLHAADDGRLQALGRAVHLVQHAVDAVAHTEFLGHGLQMDVAGPAPECLHDDQADQLDDGSVRLRDVFIPHQLFLDIVRQRQGAFRNLLQHAFDRTRGAAIVVGQGLFDLFRRRHHALDIALEHVAQAVQGVYVQRIPQRHGQDVFVFEDRDHFIALGHLARHHVEHLPGDVQSGQVDHVHAELPRQRLQHVVLRNAPLPLQDFHDPLVLLGGDFPGGDRLFPCHQPHILKDFKDIIVVRCQGAAPCS